MKKICSRSPEYATLRESLYFLYVEELRGICIKLSLSTKGLKKVLIDRILVFVTTGEKQLVEVFPLSAYGTKEQKRTPDALMLKGIYKNDLKNRLLLKSLIGDHFHFTAFGIDWLKERWREGQPPTYGEFARMWQETYEKRKQKRAPLKKEWAYMRFCEMYRAKHKNVSYKQIQKAWEYEREKCMAFVTHILMPFF
jgi:hypothetical protein